MCCMWSTNDPPDEIEGTEPFCDIEDDALDLYDMNLNDAAKFIIEIQKKKC